jgi:hypothetical protein
MKIRKKFRVSQLKKEKGPFNRKINLKCVPYTDYFDARTFRQAQFQRLDLIEIHFFVTFCMQTFIAQTQGLLNIIKHHNFHFHVITFYSFPIQLIHLVHLLSRHLKDSYYKSSKFVAFYDYHKKLKILSTFSSENGTCALREAHIWHVLFVCLYIILIYIYTVTCINV